MLMAGYRSSKGFSATHPSEITTLSGIAGRYIRRRLFDEVRYGGGSGPKACVTDPDAERRVRCDESRRSALGSREPNPLTAMPFPLGRMRVCGRSGRPSSLKVGGRPCSAALRLHPRLAWTSAAGKPQIPHTQTLNFSARNFRSPA